MKGQIIKGNAMPLQKRNFIQHPKAAHNLTEKQKISIFRVLENGDLRNYREDPNYNNLSSG